MSKTNLNYKNLLGIEDLTDEDIDNLLEIAGSMKEVIQRPIKKVPTLKGKTIISLFFEPSTRTKLSFEIAAKRLSADTISFSTSTSSITKGENLLDTVKNCEMMSPDMVIIRHPSSGAPHFLAKHINRPIINAGDGINQHPTQALLDLFTIREFFPNVKGLKVAIIGDIKHSRVAHSNILLLTRLGAKVHVCGPPTLLDPRIETLGASICHKVEDAIKDAHVVMCLRIQKERFTKGMIPSIREYANIYGIDTKRLSLAHKDAILMHPGPVNWGIELSPDIMHHPRNLILDQVTNGVAMRMAILYYLSNQGKKDD